MKRLLLSLCLTTAVLSAQAQISQLVGLGVALGTSAALKPRASNPDEYVTTISYHGRTFQQKRTPANKLKGKGVAQITQIEQTLAALYTAMLASETEHIVGAVQWGNLAGLKEQLAAVRPQWSVTAYGDEAEFYRNEDYRRGLQREGRARQRAAATRDSIQALAMKAARRTDSLRVLAQQYRQARIDSIQRAEALASPYRYVNTPELIMRVSPAPTAKKWATIGGGSIIELVQAGPEWSKVKASDRTGYVPSKYLVGTTAEVAPEYIDQTMVWLVGRDYSSVSWEDDAPAVRKPASKPIAARKAVSGPVVYYCTSGNTVKYHATSGCRGLTRCGSSVSRIELRDAQQSMDPCKWCY